jgi:predicted DNA repair protein MutK
MASGLLALLDDVVALAKVAAASLDDVAAQAVKASGKAAGVVIDDAAVTPRYVVGFAAERELPIIGRIAVGSLKNKILFLLPAALLLSALAPWAIVPLLMLGGVFLCFEGYEKVDHIVWPHPAQTDTSHATSSPADAKTIEETTVAGAIRTDFILSAEIMAITLASIEAPTSLLMQAFVLLVVALLVTAGVYGVVAIIVKADDFGLYLAQRRGTATRAIGRATVHGMPPFLRMLSFVGTVAMLWVGGGIIIHGLHTYGVEWPDQLVHLISDAARDIVPVLGGLLASLAAIIVSAVFGMVIGAITVLAVMPVVTSLWRTVRPAAFALAAKTRTKSGVQ